MEPLTRTAGTQAREVLRRYDGTMQEAPGTGRDLQLVLPSPMEELHSDVLEGRNVRLFLKRDDLIHPDVAGNKWRKLKHNLTAARELGSETILTFGGAYSNHIRATAAAAWYLGFSTIGVIRGEEHLPLNPSLAYAASRGMRLTYLDRTAYREKERPAIVQALHDRFGDFFLVPEGGGNALGVRGCAEIPDEIEVDFDAICCPCGTGATLAGIAGGLRDGQHAVGFAALKGGAFLDGAVQALQSRTFGHQTANWTIETEFHFGGFAQRTAQLDRFIEDMKASHAPALEWVYVAKMMYGILALVERGRWESGQAVVAVITG